MTTQLQVDLLDRCHYPKLVQGLLFLSTSEKPLSVSVPTSKLYEEAHRFSTLMPELYLDPVELNSNDPDSDDSESTLDTAAPLHLENTLNTVALHDTPNDISPSTSCLHIKAPVVSQLCIGDDCIIHLSNPLVLFYIDQ
ncbi:hypothetical protein PAXINDRAFT_16026 [Paxillus involutus ATCC 200175]|uniref:Unplaced genomic scaffold PAXINscaffold_66, whole genome shotgun sequence n=1 Tax=Paxillus involutus ATCC 200175 TaxID=664439 RepID=A0A0C9TUZ1_PAXIN|nr:hypothetical protein PAXINDRAFT_16026 [Paxillus involutus ATCC 200175]